MQRNLLEAGDSVGLTSSECQAAWLPVLGVCLRSYWERNRGKHSAILVKDPSKYLSSIEKTELSYFG